MILVFTNVHPTQDPRATQRRVLLKEVVGGAVKISSKRHTL